MCLVSKSITQNVRSAQQNAVNSPLLRLPTDLRLRIFESAVKLLQVRYTLRARHYAATVSLETDSNPRKIVRGSATSYLQIASTFRQIFREMTALFCSTNEFLVDLYQIQDFLLAAPGGQSHCREAYALRETRLDVERSISDAFYGKSLLVFSPIPLAEHNGGPSLQLR